MTFQMVLYYAVVLSGTVTLTSGLFLILALIDAPPKKKTARRKAGFFHAQNRKVV